MTPRRVTSSWRACGRRIAGAVAATLTAVNSPIFAPNVACGDVIRIDDKPIENAVPLGLAGGELIFRVGYNTRSVALTSAIVYLDSAPALKPAEEALARRDRDGAIRLFREALDQADDGWSRAWCAWRLSDALDRDDRLSEAAGAWAQATMWSLDPAWARVAPRTEAAEDVTATKRVAAAALQLLAEAAEVSASLESAELAKALTSVTERVREVHSRAPEGEAPAEDASPPIVSDPERPPTVIEDDPVASGPAPQIEVEARDTEHAIDSDSGSADDELRSRNSASAAATPTAMHDLKAQRIDSLLKSGRYSEAMAQHLEALIAAPGDYPLDRLLYQYGRALRGTGEARDAAVRFMQCAILFNESDFAAASLYAAGQVCLVEWRRPEVARRLYDRALALATARGDEALASEIRAAIDAL